MKDLIKKIFSSSLGLTFLLSLRDRQRINIALTKGSISNLNRSIDLTETVSWEFSGFSQNGEDGILDYLLNKLKVDSKNFIEIGVGDYRESNTRFLYQKYHPKGLIVDYIDDMEKR